MRAAARASVSREAREGLPLAAAWLMHLIGAFERATAQEACGCVVLACRHLRWHACMPMRMCAFPAGRVVLQLAVGHRYAPQTAIRAHAKEHAMHRGAALTLRGRMGEDVLTEVHCCRCQGQHWLSCSTSGHTGRPWVALKGGEGWGVGMAEALHACQ